jgi:phage tail tape-measure protein
LRRRWRPPRPARRRRAMSAPAERAGAAAAAARIGIESGGQFAGGDGPQIRHGPVGLMPF